MIRFAELCDIEGINVIHEQLHIQHIGYRPDIFAPIEQPVFDSLMKEYLTAENKRIIVSENDGVIDGYAAVTICDTSKGAGEILPFKFIEVNEFSVLQGCGNRHIGTDMMDFVKAFAKEQGAKFVELSVHAENTGAQEFYKAKGFNVKTLKMQYTV